MECSDKSVNGQKWTERKPYQLKYMSNVFALTVSKEAMLWAYLDRWQQCRQWEGTMQVTQWVANQVGGHWSQSQVERTWNSKILSSPTYLLWCNVHSLSPELLLCPETMATNTFCFVLINGPAFCSLCSHFTWTIVLRTFNDCHPVH